MFQYLIFITTEKLLKNPWNKIIAIESECLKTMKCTFSAMRWMRDIIIATDTGLVGAPQYTELEVANDNDIIPGSVHRSPGIFALQLRKSPVNLS